MAINSIILSKDAKEFIDTFMLDSIIKNQIIPLEYIMGFLWLEDQEIDEQIVIKYIEANYPSGYLLVDFDPLDKLIAEAVKGKDVKTVALISNAMMNKDFFTNLTI